MKNLVIFDLDNTLIKGQSQRLLLIYMFKKREIKLFPFLKILLWFVFYKLDFVKNPKEIMEYSFQFLKNRNVNEFEKKIGDFFEKKLKNKFFKESLDLIEKHKKEGREIIIVSNAIEPLVKRAASFLGLNNFIGTKLEYQDGFFTGRIDGNIITGKNKVIEIEKFLKSDDFKEIWAYGDQITDLPFLEISTKPFVVNPDSLLRKVAKERNWPILNFKL